MATGNEPIHPAACIFPEMDAASLRELANDIKVNGQREPVVYWREQLLDGRNRIQACKIAGVEPESCELDGDNDFDPFAYVLSVNLHRRHLSESQRAMVAARMKKLLEPAAKERKVRGQKKGGNTAGRGRAKPAENSLGANSPASNGATPHRASDQAAATLNVGRKSVDAAAIVIANGSKELQQAVERGEVSVSKAAKIAKTIPKKEQLKSAQETTPKKEQTPFDHLKHWWSKANDTQKSLFRDWIDTH